MISVSDITSRLHGVRKSGNGYEARCPAHDDKNASLSVAESGAGKVLLHCHAGCATESIVAALGYSMADLMGEGPPKKRIAATYGYTDSSGGLLFQKVRYEPKGFSIRRPDGKGGWAHNRRGVALAPYNLQVLANSESAFLVEGEKDVETLREMGIVATCSPDGAGKGKFKKELAQWFKGKTVCIVPDNDETGRSFALEEARILHPAAKSVKVLDLLKICPDLDEHGDISDIALKLGKDAAKDALQKLAESTPDCGGDPLAEPAPDAQSDPGIVDTVIGADFEAKDANAKNRLIKLLLSEALLDELNAMEQEERQHKQALCRAKAKALRITTEFDKNAKAHAIKRSRELFKEKKQSLDDWEFRERLEEIAKFATIGEDAVRGFEGFFYWEEKERGDDVKMIARMDAPGFVKFFNSGAVPYFVSGFKGRTDAQLYLYRGGCHFLANANEVQGLIMLLVPDGFKLEFRNSATARRIYDDIIRNPVRKELGECNPENAICFMNGVYLPDSGELRPHSPDDAFTVQMPLSCNLNAKKPAESHFVKFMNHLTGGDGGQFRLLMEFIGLAMSNMPVGKAYKQALLLVGGGNTGKSTLLRVIENLLGDGNCVAIKFEKLEENNFATSKLLHKRLACEHDMKSMKLADISVFKNIVGGDMIDAEFKGENAFSFRFDGLLWLNTNDLPKFGGDKGGHVYDRFVIVNAVGKTYGRGEPPMPGAVERDPGLEAKIMEESEYIVWLAMMALKDLRKRGSLNLTQRQKENMERHKFENSTIAAFFSECAVDRVHPGKMEDLMTKGMSYLVYKAWSREGNKGFEEGKTAFHSFADKDPWLGQVSRTSSSRFYANWTCTQEAKGLCREYYPKDSKYKDLEDDFLASKSKGGAVVDLSEWQQAEIESRFFPPSP
jgi:P4 family phage/plasmid primase-like protien